MTDDTEAQFGTDSVGSGNRKTPTRRRSRAWFFTLDNANLDMVAQLQQDFEAAETEYVFQYEKGKENGMLHFQGVCRYKNPRDKWPMISYQAHWERPKGGWRNCVKYCTKVDTRLEGPWSNIPGLKFRETVKDPMLTLEWKKWQLDLQAMLDRPIHPRHVYWIWEEVGGVGKSTFCKHLLMSYPGTAIVSGTTRDSLFCLSSMMEETDIKLVLFDIPRCDRLGTNGYKTIEMVKNGMFFSGKYESRFRVFNSPHVLVFSNYEPDYSELSADRWNVTNIGEYAE